MLRPPSSLRSLFHLSGRLRRPPNPRFPGPPNPPLPSPSSPLFTRSRFHSSSSSPKPCGAGAGRATYDYDPLIDSLCASASDIPLDPDIWAIYDPVSGRIVIQRLLPLWPSSIGEEGEKGEGAGERGDEEKAGVNEKEKGKGEGRRKGWASDSGVKGQTRRLSVAAARKPAGKGGKQRALYVCINCGEGHRQWWHLCRYCEAAGTIQKTMEMVLQVDGDPSEEGEGAGEREDEARAGGKEKGKVKAKCKRKRKGRASSTGEEGQTNGSSVAASGKSAGKAGKEKFFHVCSHCGETHPRWWGLCRNCQMKGTLQKSRETVPQSLEEVNIVIQGPPLSLSSIAVDEEEGAGEHEDEEKVGVKEKEKGEGKRKWKRQGRARASCKESLGKGSKESVLFECSNCGEGNSQWWGICRHCKASRTLHRRA